MPLTETLPVGADTAQWSVWGTTARVVVTDPVHIGQAESLVRNELAQVDAACSRFRPDSELVRLAQGSGGTSTVTPLLAALVSAALGAARETNGDVDPTMGNALSALGYDRDFRHIRVGPATVTVVPTVDWRSIRLQGNDLTVPPGTLLDLGATAKAWAADRCAALVAQTCGVGALVALGGDIATAGPAPAGGWQVLVQDGPDEPAQLIGLTEGYAMATSSTISRRWRRPGHDATDQRLHHILDPRTGRPARTVWRTATVAAPTCLRANTLSTAALVRGSAAPRWLAGLGVAARLVSAHGIVRTINGWPES